MKAKVKFGVEQYWKSTPKTLRKMGDAALAAATVGATLTASSNPKFALILGIAGVAGKFLSNFFSEDSKSHD